MLRLTTVPADGPGTSPDVTRSELDLDSAGTAELSASLLELVSDPVVREAIEVSSGSLAGTIDRVESGDVVEPAKLRRAVLSAVRYVLRMRGRPTPFGLFAGVSLVQVDETAKVRIGDQHVRQVRPDAGWLHTTLLRLCRIPAVRDRLWLTTNNLCQQRGDRLVLPYVRQLTEDTSKHKAARRPDRLVSIGYSPVVQAAVEAAHRPIAYPELRTHLVTAFPEADQDDADRLLGQLIEREILLTDLTARWDVADQFELVRERLAGVDDPDVAALRRVADRLDAYAGMPIGEGRTAWRQAVEELTATHRTDQPPIQVDLRMDADLRLPRALVDEVAKLAGVLWRLSPAGVGQLDIRAYHEEFLGRYGTERQVPVLELVDPHFGLGPPAGYGQPPGERPDPAYPDNPHSRERDELLAAVLTGSRDGELLLDDELVDRLSGTSGQAGESGESEDEPPPDSLDLCVQLFAESVEAVNAGDYQLAIAPGAGSQTAGGMCGRFATMLGAESRLAELFEPDTDPKLLPVRAQLFFQPALSRHGNVSRVPSVLPYRVPVGCFDDVGDERVLDVRDLAVRSDGRRLRLVAPRLGREISVLRQHMLNMRTAAPNVARLLAALDHSGVRQWASWLWSRLDVLPSLPRVRYGRTVLSPALWRPDRTLADRALSWPEWQRALHDWRDRYNVPDLVRISVFDNHLEVDLSVPLQQRLFRDHVQRHATTPVWESSSGYGSTALTGGQPNELVVPLLSRTPRQAEPELTNLPPREPAVRRHLPGDEWLYAKVYVLSDLQDALLVREVRALVERMGDAVDQWYFLRYRDPGAHLRLRFHGPALPVLRAWAETAMSAGLIRSLQLDTYEPEIQRYGGPAAMRLAERLFHADSVAVVEQLALRAGGELVLPIETLAAANYVDLLGSLGDWDWRQWVTDAFPVELSNDVPVAVRREANRWIDPGRRWERLAELPGADRLLAGWRHRAPAARAYGEAIDIQAGPDRAHIHGVRSVLHLHANRLIGTDREVERRACGLLRAAVQADLDERRHRR